MTSRGLTQHATMMHDGDRLEVITRRGRRPSSDIPKAERIDPLDRVNLPNHCPCCAFELHSIYVAMNLPGDRPEVSVHEENELLKARLRELGEHV